MNTNLLVRPFRQYASRKLSNVNVHQLSKWLKINSSGCTGSLVSGLGSGLGSACLHGSKLNFHSSSLSKSPVPKNLPNIGLGPNGGRLVEFNLADIGEGIAECEILRWFINEGQTIQQFDKVCEVQSDKANVEITSRFDGVVRKLNYPVGALAKVGKPLLLIELNPSASPSSNQPQSNLSGAALSTSISMAHLSEETIISNNNSNNNSNASDSNLSRFVTSPAVRRMAREHNINLSEIRPTGPSGRILKEDVLAYLDSLSNKKLDGTSNPNNAQISLNSNSPAPVTPIQSNTVPNNVSNNNNNNNTSPSISSYLSNDVVVPVSGLQRIMVSTMNAAAAVPTFGFSDDICMDSLVSLREELKPIAAKHGVKLSYLPFIIKAVSLSLREYPSLNAHVAADCSSVTHRASHNIGIAMDTPRGLLVPNIKNVQNLSILGIAAELNRLSSLGALGKLGKDDLTGGTFSLSNIGSIGGTTLRPILVVPEVVIGALGSIKVLPRYNSKMTIVPSSIMVVSWSGDHRVLDGATVARFSNLFKSYLEAPSKIILETK